MMYAVIGGHLAKIKRIHPFEAPNVVAVFVGVRAALRMGVDAAMGAEVMFSRHRVELAPTFLITAPNPIVLQVCLSLAARGISMLCQRQ